MRRQHAVAFDEVFAGALQPLGRPRIDARAAALDVPAAIGVFLRPRRVAGLLAARVVLRGECGRILRLAPRGAACRTQNGQRDRDGKIDGLHYIVLLLERFRTTYIGLVHEAICPDVAIIACARSGALGDAARSVKRDQTLARISPRIVVWFFVGDVAHRLSIRRIGRLGSLLFLRILR